MIGVTVAVCILAAIAGTVALLLVRQRPAAPAPSYRETGPTPDVLSYNRVGDTGPITVTDKRYCLIGVAHHCGAPQFLDTKYNRLFCPGCDEWTESECDCCLRPPGKPSES